MNAQVKANLKAAGYSFGDYGDFLELTPAEREQVELETALARVIRAIREKTSITQSELARRIGSSQSRVAKIEAGVEGVSLDLSFKALFALGGTTEGVTREIKQAKKRSAPKKSNTVAA